MVKTVMKPWGHETWLADGTSTPYALKKILFKAGNRTSLQVHKFKVETNYVLEGRGTLLVSDKFFDIDRYLNKEMTEDEIYNHIEALKPIELFPGIVKHIQPGHLHRVLALTDLVFMEASSTELDDVVRLADDTNRTHGRIDSEHR